MITDQREIYSRLNDLSRAVKEQLRKKGVVVPSKTKEGDIKVGYYNITKRDGFYTITDYADQVVVEKINLPQSAALLANKLALGKYLDTDILNADRRYGHALFEQTLQEKIAKNKLKIKEYDVASLLLNKAGINKLKKEYYRNIVVSGFEKLIKVR